MKIVDVTLTLFAWDDIPATSYGAHTGRFSGASKLGLLSIVTDAGVTGHAFLGSAFYAADMDGASLIRYLKPILMGQHPLDRERLNKAMWKRVRTTTVRAIGAVDIALWDIAGKAAQLPIHRLLGSYRDRVPAYISSAVLASPQAYADEALHYKSLNMGAYKIHPPQAWREDIQVCEAVRKAVGDDYLLMLDSVWSYDYPAALRVGQAIEAMGYYWYEDPLADADIYNYVELRKKLNIPIMATEYPAADGYKLSVNGKIIGTEVRVDALANWPDYVFSGNHKMLSLEELEASINTNKHLPGIPSAAEVKEKGIMLGDMQTKTMEKVEELTLYLIQLSKENKELKARLEKLETR